MGNLFALQENFQVDRMNSSVRDKDNGPVNMSNQSHATLNGPFPAPQQENGRKLQRGGAPIDQWPIPIKMKS
jgi:hypothetical protein